MSLRSGEEKQQVRGQEGERKVSGRWRGAKKRGKVIKCKIDRKRWSERRDESEIM